MTPAMKGLVLAVLHVLLVCGLGGKLLIDRAIRPRVWVDVAPFDPDLPIRGRYVRLQVLPVARGFTQAIEQSGWGDALLSVEEGRLIATRCDSPCGEPVRVRTENGETTIVLATPVAYFIPEHVPDPSSRPGLVAEVTVPRKGPPRPIRLGVREGERIIPIDL
jgi:hypothetical protein